MAFDKERYSLPLSNGEDVFFTRDVQGYYCPICGEGPAEYPAYELQNGTIQPLWWHDICSVCRTQFEAEFELTSNDTAKSFAEAVLSLRLTWLCREGWPAEGIRLLQDNLGLSDADISELERLAGKAHGIDRRFRSLGKYEVLPQPTCPCCGLQNAVVRVLGRCPFCGWFFTPLQEIDPDDGSGPNSTSLRKAQWALSTIEERCGQTVEGIGTTRATECRRS